MFTYPAEVTGEFYERSYPAEKELRLKVGAQVMFIKNDKGEARRFYNGKIGTIKKLESEKIVVEFANEENQAIDFEIYSQDLNDDIIHCQGQAQFGLYFVPAQLELVQLKSQMTQGKFDAASLYPLFANMGLNYGAAMQATAEAKNKGYDQVLWMDANEHKYVQEIGTMNVFFIIGNTAITPDLEDGTILDGVTRQSAIALLKEMGLTV